MAVEVRTGVRQKEQASAYVLGPDGSRREVQPANGLHFGLEELQGLVGGYVEVQHCTDATGPKLMVCNEDGKMLGLHPNAAATAIWRSSYPSDPHVQTDTLVGPVVLVRPDQMQ